MLPTSVKNAWLDLKAMSRFERRPPRASLAELAGSVRCEAQGRTPSVLCLHGFGGVPREVEPAFEEAERLGLHVVAPVLRGHGTVPADLATTRFEDWLAGAQQEFDQLRQRGPVVLLGLSLGSLLATSLTLSAPGDVAGLVLLANAFWLQEPFPATALSIYQLLRLPDLGVWKARSDLSSPEGLATHLSYGVQPIFAANSVRQAGVTLREELFRIHCPTLILHGARDRVCPVQNAWKVAERMTEITPRVVVFPRSHHILTKDVESQWVREEVRAFLQKVSTQSDGKG